MPDDPVTPDWQDLWTASLKLRSIAHLFENQKANPLPSEEEMEQVFRGLGCLLGELSQVLASLSRAWEQSELKPLSARKPPG